MKGAEKVTNNKGQAPFRVLAVTRTDVRVPNQSASADSPFATSLSWWKADTRNVFEPAWRLGLSQIRAKVWKTIPQAG